MNTEDWLADTRISYDTVAGSYAERMRDALDATPYARAALDLFAEAVRADGGGPVADVGCGPGHVTARLRDAGLDAFGVDLSPGMIEVARREHPEVRFQVGSMTALPLADASLAGLVAFWSLVHTPEHALPGVLGHFHRALRPGGLLLAGFSVGDTSMLKTEGYGGHPMKVHVYRRRPDRVAAALRDIGFTVEAHLLLDPDGSRPGAILFARRQGDVAAYGSGLHRTSQRRG